jgi:hypothetical protein
MLPARLAELVEELTDLPRKLRRVPTRSSRELGGDQGNATREECEDPYLTSIEPKPATSRAHAIRSRSNPAGVLVDAWVNDVPTYESPVRSRVQGATP